MESMNHLYKTDAVNWSGLAPNDPTIGEWLDICPICDQWDHANATNPINIPIMPTNKKGGVSSHFYRHAWMTKPSGTQIAVIHRKLFDIVSEDFDDDILVGEVYIHGGDRIPDLISLVDRVNLVGRSVYSKSLFRYPGMSSRWAPCHYCGRDLAHRHNEPGYIFTEEYSRKSPRVTWASLLVNQETYAKAHFEDSSKWPKLNVGKVIESDRLLDPFPFPSPIMWDDMVKAMRERGVPFPDRLLDIHHTERPGPWIQQKILELGHKQVLLDTSLSHGLIDPDTLNNMIFYLRVRALFEQKVAERIDHWDDVQLRSFLIEYHEASGSLGSYFPV